MTPAIFLCSVFVYAAPPAHEAHACIQQPSIRECRDLADRWMDATDNQTAFCTFRPPLGWPRT